MIPAVEIDSLYNLKRCHIIGYGFDPDSAMLAGFVDKNKRDLEDADRNTLKNISADYKIDINEYDSFVFKEAEGGWKLIQFLVAKGLAEDLDSAIKLMKQYKQRINFPEPKTVIDQIHRAGGIAVLAHPGETFHVNNGGDEETDRHIKQLIEYGLDGIECFYPRHKPAFETRLYNICMEHDMYVTVGSDYHGDFFKNTKQMIGCEFKRLKDLKLKNLLDVWGK